MIQATPANAIPAVVLVVPPRGRVVVRRLPRDVRLGGMSQNVNLQDGLYGGVQSAPEDTLRG